MAPPMETFICVDFGMAGSATSWRNNQSPFWNTTKPKIPTMLAYDSNGTLMAWGKCEGGPYDSFQECFKSYIATTTFPDFPGAPTSKQVLFRWVQDYLTAICKQTALEIDAERVDGWRNGFLTWNFTVPGSWAKFPVVADFKRLAENAVFSCLTTTDKIRVHAHLTEGEASAICVLNRSRVAKSHEFAVGDIVVSCDIGGATTDIAISIVSGAGKLDPCPPLQLHPVGLMSVNRNFWELARQTFRLAGLQQNADVLALVIARSQAFTSARERFSAADGERIIISIPIEYSIHDWPPRPAENHKKLFIIKYNKLIIHRDVFESLFEDLVQQIEAGLDEAINKLATAGKTPSAIGFCGGGSRSVYLMDRLRRRYGEETVIIIDHRQLTVPPELATVTGSSLVCDKTQLQKFVQNTRFGVQQNEDSTLKAAEENKENSNFYMAPAWVVTLSCSAHRGQITKHTIFAVSANAAEAGPENNDLKDRPTLMKWIVEIDLTRNKKVGSRKKKLKILCKITGAWTIDVEVRSQLGQVIPSKI
ncbi:hypothetical protein DL95DRAFT_454848 [Leptodontidium sp. 2 PMI_412]|nr:hypothetical protein DL95DRAFT_454848 [Leptodontidium sp. 2 PMI_412]